MSPRSRSNDAASEARRQSPTHRRVRDERPGAIARFARRGRGVVAALVAITTIGVWPSAAGAEEQTSTEGSVSATFSFSRDGDTYSFADLWLTITRGDETVYDDAPEVGDCDYYDSCGPAGAERDSVRVQDLDGDGEPEVLLDLYWGGAHCCFFANVYSFDGSGYESVSRNFADASYRLGDIDAEGVPEFVSADARFAYRFTSFASSLFPVQILSFFQGRFYDQTDQYPDRVKADASRAWHFYRRALTRGDYEPRGAIAAWAADEYRLGKRAAALRTLRGLARHHRLPGTFPTSQPAFVRKLDGFLRRTGYAD